MPASNPQQSCGSGNSHSIGLNKIKEGVMVDKEKKEVDYTTLGYDQLMVEVGKAWEAKDMKLMGQLSRLATKAEADVEKTKKAALLAELVEKTLTVRNTIAKAIAKMVDAGELDGAEGIWYAQDFGAMEEVGINPACRLVKTGRKASGEGGGSSQSSYVANPAKSADLLAQVGSEVMFAEDTPVTIDKVERVMAAGTTYKEAYDFSTNGGWRNRVRMALLKKAGII